MGWTLNRYFFRRYAVITGWFFLGIFTIAYLIDFTEFSGRTSRLPKFTMEGALLVSALHIPSVMQQIIPFIALFSGIATLISLNRKYELVVTRAAGVSVWQFLLPACAGAFLFGVIAVTAINPLAAWGFEKALEIEADWRSQQSNATIASNVPWLRQRTEDGETIIGAKAALRGGILLSDVVFLRFDDLGNIVLRQDAETAVLEDGYWALTNVRVSEPGKVPVTLESSRVATKLTSDVLQQTLQSPSSVPFFLFPGKIELANAYGYPAYPLRTEFQSLLALPALLVAMTLIAATVSLKFVRFGQSGAMIVGGVLAGFLLYVVSILVKAFGSAGIVLPVVAAWFPVIVAAFFGATYLLFKEDG